MQNGLRRRRKEEREVWGLKRGSNRLREDKGMFELC